MIFATALGMDSTSCLGLGPVGCDQHPIGPL
jgi:hypothetical protein